MASSEKQKHMIFPRHVLVGGGVLDRVGETVADLELEPNGVIVVDANTRKLVGDRVLKSLREAGLVGHVYESPGPTMASVQGAMKAGPCSKAASLATSMTEPPPAPMYQCAPTFLPALMAPCTDVMVGPGDS